MPVHRGKDSNGPYYQYGHAKKYYYTSNNKMSREKAKNKAKEQGRAIEYRKHKK